MRFGKSICAVVFGLSLSGCGSGDQNKLNSEVSITETSDTRIVTEYGWSTGWSTYRQIEQKLDDTGSAVVCETFRAEGNTGLLYIVIKDGCRDSTDISGNKHPVLPDGTVDYIEEFRSGSNAYHKLNRQESYYRHRAIFQEADALFAKTRKLMEPHLYNSGMQIPAEKQE